MVYLFQKLLIASAASGAVLGPVYWILSKTGFCTPREAALGFVFSEYLSVVFSFVGLPSLAYWKYLGFELNLNLIPFRGMAEDLQNAILNAVMFVPLGILLPVCWQKYRSVISVMGFAFLLSLSIELLQMFTYRATDIDDLITNTLGAVIGYGIAMSILKVNRSPALLKGKRIFYIAITSFIMFFAQPYLVYYMELLLYC